MTVQPTRDQLRALANAATPGPWTPCTEGWATISSGSDSVIHAYHPRDCCHECGEPYDMEPGVAIGVEDLEFIAAARTAVPQLLDQLDLAEAELDSWMARAYEAEKRAWQAEARIKAVRDVLDSYDNIRRYLSDSVINTCSEIRSALEGTN